MNYMIKSIVSLGLIFTLLVAQTSPINVRNNNPCNIKHNKNNVWLGSIYSSGIFEKFKNKELGYRACVIVTMSNIINTNSVEGFVGRFATEPFENSKTLHLRNYSKAIAEELGYTTKIHLKDTLKVVKIIIRREGGVEASTYYNNLRKENGK